VPIILRPHHAAAVSFALLAQIGLNFLRVFISPQLQVRFKTHVLFG
jgi:hypothetical protein